ncbi:hypothetical protein [Desulfoferrobacter suflitae]|nr:hypothetical protein [Desulfoferrobacter suflitae]
MDRDLCLSSAVHVERRINQRGKRTAKEKLEKESDGQDSSN